MTASGNSRIFDIPPCLRTMCCGTWLQIDQARFEAFFERSEIRCTCCGKPVQLWKTSLREISENFMLNQAFSLVSARTTVFSIWLKPSQSTQYKLSDFGVPEDAKILYVNYTSCGNLWPIELHGNVPTLRGPRQTMHLWPVPPRDGDVPKDTEVNVMVTWVPHSKFDDSWKNLVAAFEAYASNDYQSSVVPANVAVESTLGITLNAYLSQFVSRERIESFLKDAATYGHQLNVLSPVIAKLTGVTELDPQIRGLLNTLRDLRNKLAHHGMLDKPLEKQRCAELLCAAVFGFQYTLYLRRKLGISGMSID